jgi:hypothetical protein
VSISLSAALTAEMNSLSRRPAAALTVERFLPEWSQQVAGSETVHYAHGHAACVVEDGNGAGEDILFRARVTAAGELQIAILKGVDLETPSSWDGLWTSTGLTGLVYPHWVSDAGVEYGGSVACAFASGSSTFRVFVFNSAGEVKNYDFDTDGSLTATRTVAALAADEAMQLASCVDSEVFILRHEQVEQSHAAWHKPVYGSTVRRYTFDGADWNLDGNPFLFHTHAEGHLVKDGPAYDAGSDDQVAQWGFRPCGGLGAISLSNDTALVVVGLRYFYRKAYKTHTQSIIGWLYHRDNGVWERAFDNDEADYDLEQQLWLDGFARGMTVDGRPIITWVRLVEPADTEQLAAGLHIPRVLEAVYAKVSDDGRHVTQFQYLGLPQHLAGASIVALNHDGTKFLYALGWQMVLKSEPSYFLCDVPDAYKFNLKLTSSGYTVKKDNRFGMSVASNLLRAGDRFTEALLREGHLVRAYQGAVVLGPSDSTIDVIRGTDDGYVGQPSGAYSASGNNLQLGQYSPNHDANHSWLKFDLDIRPNVVISSAHLRLFNLGWSGAGVGSTTIRIRAELGPSDSAPLSHNDYFSRDRTNSYVDFTVSPADLTPMQYFDIPVDLSSVIQEVVNHPGWYEGASVLLFLETVEADDMAWFLMAFETGGISKLLITSLSSEVVELTQIAQGFIDTTSPTISLEQRIHEGPLNARAELQLLATKAEVVEEILPMETLTIEPVHPGGEGTIIRADDGTEITQHHPAGVALHRGMWALRKAAWPTLFFDGVYPDLENKLMYRMESFPWAVTGGGPTDLPVGVQGGPGDIADPRKAYKKGTMFNDIVWTTIPSSRIDGAIQACVRFGDDRNYGDFQFKALSNHYVRTVVHRTNGLITNIEWFNGGATPPGDVWEGDKWNDVFQESCMVGLICRSVQDPKDTNGTGKKYIFAWEANSDFIAGSSLEDTGLRVYGNGIFDNPDYSGVSVGRFDGAGRFYLLISDFDETDENWQANEKWIHKAVAEGAATGLETGKPAEMKLQVYGGTIYCFYRPYPTSGNPKNLWRHAITHKAGHFGAGKFGVVARGHSGIQWDVLWPGRNHIDQTDNTVHVWDVEATDCEKDWTLEEILRHFAHQGLTETEFRSEVSDASRVVPAGTSYDYNEPVENLCLDFTVNIDADAGEAGVYVRAVNGADPAQDCVYLGLVVHSTYKQVDNTVNCYLVKRRYHAGVEVVDARDYSPSVLHLKPGLPYRVRVSVRNDVYSVWVEGCHMGHFHDDTELGTYWGVYATGQQATFTNVRLPELHEVPENAILDPNQAMMEAIKKSIGQRHIKGVWRPYGKLLISQFKDHDEGPTFQDNVLANTPRLSDRSYSVVEVQGAYTRATYVNTALLSRGRRYIRVDNPDIMTTERCYKEAKLICQEEAERMEEVSFIGLPDLRVEPEDAVTLVVSQQDINGVYLVDDVTIQFDIDKRQSGEQFSTRQQVIL